MKKVIHWFRQDLRLSDNPALLKASNQALALPIYILDDHLSQKALGSASRFWLYYSLKALNLSLDKKLCLYKGNPLDILKHLIKTHNIKEVYWNHCYEPWQIKRDSKIKKELLLLGIKVQTESAFLLWEPYKIQKKDGTPFKVFTPFYKKALDANTPRAPLNKPKSLNLYYDSSSQIKIEGLKALAPPFWSHKLKKHWEIGEAGAKKKLAQFLKTGIPFYKEGRGFPAKPYVSKLSPHLHFGEISPNQIWHKIKSIGGNPNTACFHSELGWREFSYNQLYYNHDLSHKNLQSKFDHFPWKKNKLYLKAWQKGRTGVPMVDAGMRELWETGAMHNRARMITGSFLAKNLLLDWREGEQWFWDCLVDADLANNSAGWQWTAGCGYDPAPYFRVFNPVIQGQKFDPEGVYIRRFIPELKNLSNRYIFSPWEAPQSVLKKAGVKLGESYPHPIVDLKESRNLALQAFQSLQKETALNLA